MRKEFPLLRTWIKDSENADETAVSPDLFAKKSCAQKLSGSNPYLQNKTIRFVPILPSASLREARVKNCENDSILHYARQDASRGGREFSSETHAARREEQTSGNAFSPVMVPRRGLEPPSRLRGTSS